MQEKKKNADLEKLIQEATKKGIDLIPIIQFFTSWYPPKEIIPLLDKLEHQYMWLFLGDEDANMFNKDAREHIVFLDMFKEHLGDASICK